MPAAGAAELNSLQALSIHPPRDSWGGCKTPMTCAGNCRNTLLAGASHSDLSQAPRTTGPASSRGRRDAGLPAVPLPAPLPARGMGRRQQSSCIPHQAHPMGRSAAMEGGTALGSISSSSGFFSPPCPFICRSLKKLPGSRAPHSGAHPSRARMG